jgi:hypothetical protein
VVNQDRYARIATRPLLTFPADTRRPELIVLK